MSAINVIVKSNAVHVLTDGAAYESDGTLSSIGPKVNLMPHQSCAVAFRGPQSVRPILGELIGLAAPSFAELKAVIVPLLQEASRAYAPLFEGCSAGPDFEVVVAGWSDEGPAAYMVASHDRHSTPWEIIPLTGLCITPADETIHEKMLATLPTDCTADDIDPATHGLAILEIQRSHLVENDGIDGKFCAVGGFAQLTTVTPDAVTSRIIHRWPDGIGERLAVG